MLKHRWQLARQHHARQAIPTSQEPEQNEPQTLRQNQAKLPRRVQNAQKDGQAKWQQRQHGLKPARTQTQHDQMTLPRQKEQGDARRENRRHDGKQEAHHQKERHDASDY
jgi:hypothetical protein